MRGVVAALLVMALLAGCASDPKADALDAVADPASSASATNTTAPANTTVPLVANLTADALNGTAPLLVNLTVSATPGTAPLSWVVAVNGTELGNGTSVPATLNHTFLEAGLWNVTLTVTSGARNATASVAVNVTGGASARFPVLLATYTNSGLVGGPYALTNDPVMAHQCPGFNGGEDGFGCVFLPFPAVGAHDGLPGLVTTDAGNFRFALWDACEPTGSGVGFASGVTGGQFEIAAGTGCIVAWSSVIGDWGSEKTFTLDVYDWLPEPEA